MHLPKLLAFVALVLFGLIGVIAFFKKVGTDSETQPPPFVPIEIAIEEAPASFSPVVPVVSSPSSGALKETSIGNQETKDLPQADRINELFNRQDPRLPIVETIVYKSHVPWQKGRPAWLSDYASHYNTSRHFIARSLNGKPDYFKQEVAEGGVFNVFRKDKNIAFYLLVDSSRCRLWFYYIDLDSKERTLLKTYSVCLGRPDSSKASGLLTPIGKYSLGDRIAVYKPKVTGIHQGKKIEMLSVFGTRWIPFEKELGACTEPAKGFGIHGTPILPSGDGTYSDQGSGIGKYESDGCIRLSTEDMEEIYAIVVTKPTTIEIVPDFYQSNFLESYKER